MQFFFGISLHIYLSGNGVASILFFKDVASIFNIIFIPHFFNISFAEVMFIQDMGKYMVFCYFSELRYLVVDI